MPRNQTTGTFTRVSNSFSTPVTGTPISPADADSYFDDLDSGLTFTDASPLILVGSTSGVTKIIAEDAASGTVTVPAGTRTLVAKDTTDLLTNKTLTAPVITGLLDASAADAGQIKFPAAQNASADVNTLDDYEEGTWTPVLTFATPGDLAVTYSSQVGSYTKIGNTVRLNVNIATSAFTHTTAGGTLRISGHPFATANVTGNIAGSMAAMTGWTKANYTETLYQVAPNSSLAVFGAYGSGQAEANIVVADVATGGTVVVRATIMLQT